MKRLGDKSAQSGKPQMRQVEREFDVLVEQMQSAEHKAAVDALFQQSAKELGRASVEHSTK